MIAAAQLVATSWLLPSWLLHTSATRGRNIGGCTWPVPDNTSGAGVLRPNEVVLAVVDQAGAEVPRGATALFGFRFADQNRSETETVTMNYRFPVNQQWRLNPRLRIDHRRNDDETEQWTLRPSVRTNYRVNRSVRLELELGADWVWRELNRAPRQRTILMFGSLGYRWQF